MSVLDLPAVSGRAADRARPTPYDGDFRAWAFEQADAIRCGDFAVLDLENVAEELESLGRQLEHQLFKHYLVLTAHLLKWAHQPELRGPSWQATIVEQRVRVARLMRKNPSLKSAQVEEFAEGYAAGRARAATESGLSLSVFPTEPPFTLEQARDPDFWPEAAVAKGSVG